MACARCWERATPRTVELTTAQGNKYAVTEKLPATWRVVIERGERLQCINDVRGALANTLVPQSAGRPRKGSEGPKKGSIAQLSLRHRRGVPAGKLPPNPELTPL